jgi:LmbE family N-acetylglucosaminyl deacetylase
LCRPEELGPLRERELRCACDALGIMPPLLLDYQDGTLPTVDEQEAVRRVLAIIREIHPQVLLTWPPDGLSGHPDHVAVSRWTALAFQQAGDWTADAPAALYHLAVPRSVAEALGLAHLHAVPDDEITLNVDISPAWEQKVAAIGCHRTQLGISSILTAPLEQRQLFLGHEHFHRAAERPGPDVLRTLGKEVVAR